MTTPCDTALFRSLQAQGARDEDTRYGWFVLDDACSFCLRRGSLGYGLFLAHCFLSRAIDSTFPLRHTCKAIICLSHLLQFFFVILCPIIWIAGFFFPFLSALVLLWEDPATKFVFPSIRRVINKIVVAIAVVIVTIVTMNGGVFNVLVACA